MTTFKEAYCLMWYACKCGHRECIWNSRDGVTPFSVGCPSCNGMMQHVEWRRDTPAPEHELRPYQRYFRDRTPDDAERIMRRRIEMYPTGDPEYDKELIECARNGDDVGEFRSGWPMLDIHLPHELQHSEPGRGGLSFEQLRAANVERCETAFHALDHWNPMEWGAACAGEVGEGINAAKKLRRVEDSEQYKQTLPTTDVTLQDVADEIADAVIYADLWAARIDVDLGAAVADKFNRTSEKVQSDVRLAAPAPDAEKNDG